MYTWYGEIMDISSGTRMLHGDGNNIPQWVHIQNSILIQISGFCIDTVAKLKE